MKLRTAKAGLWSVVLAMSGTTMAAAQISTAQASSPVPRYSIQPNVPSLLSAGKPLEIESTLLAANPEPSLPDAPSAIAERQAAQEAPSPQQSVERSPQSPIAPTVGPTFWAANGLLLGSTIANAAEIGNCRPSACQSVPAAIRSRGTLFAIGIPASLGVTYISYRLKRSGTRWWIAPVALFTAGNVIYAAHAARLSNP